MSALFLFPVDLTGLRVLGFLAEFGSRLEISLPSTPLPAPAAVVLMLGQSGH